MTINASNLKKPYGAGRVPMKISLTEPTLEKLSDLGVLERVIGKSGILVAKKGGAGSAYAEFAMNFLAVMVGQSTAEELSDVASNLKLCLDTDSLQKFIENMYSLDKIINP